MCPFRVSHPLGRERAYEYGSVASITNASVAGSFNLSEARTSVTTGPLSAYGTDLNDNTQPGDTDIALASIDLEGLASGATTISVENATVQDEQGDAIAPEVDTGQVTSRPMRQARRRH